jgi:hypothetical protein
MTTTTTTTMMTTTTMTTSSAKTTKTKAPTKSRSDPATTFPTKIPPISSTPKT